MRAPRTLVLVPTETERRHLARRRDFGVDAPCALCGFGPVAAAARARDAIAAHEPRRVVLVGIAGTFDPEGLPVGTAAVFPSVVMHGVGVGTAPFVPAPALGYRHWPRRGADGADAPDALALACPAPPAAGPLLTVCAAAATEAEAGERRERFPGAAAEDMEGFGVALACRLAEVPAAIVRGISNAVGDRRFERWRIPEALDAAWTVAADLLDRPAWPPAAEPRAAPRPKGAGERRGAPADGERPADRERPADGERPA